MPQTNPFYHQVLVQKCLLLIKSICGNDDVKKLVVKSEALDLTLASITQHLSSSSVCEAAYTVIAAASLRCPSNCDIIMKKNAAELITEGMKQHLYDAGVQVCHQSFNRSLLFFK